MAVCARKPSEQQVLALWPAEAPDNPLFSRRNPPARSNDGGVMSGGDGGGRSSVENGG
jgi:hypothetical protein